MWSGQMKSMLLSQSKFNNIYPSSRGDAADLDLELEQVLSMPIMMMKMILLVILVILGLGIRRAGNVVRSDEINASVIKQVQ